MKKILKLLFSIAFISLFVACNNFNGNVKEQNDFTNHSEGMKYIGDINKIYSAPKARFMTGQIIDNFLGHQVRFEGNLVEYNSIREEILDYVEGIESNNALMHQCYDNVTYDPNKKYVEVSSYTDTTSGKIVCFEIRVFFGNFMETFNTDFWYAKSVLFNSNFTKDLDHGTTVDFGEPLETSGDVETIEDTEDNVDDEVVENIEDTEGSEEIDIFDLYGIPKNAEDKVNNELINLIGTPAEIYSATNTTTISSSARFCTAQIVNWGEYKARFQGNLVAYSTVNSKILSLFDELNFDSAAHQCYSDVTYDSTKTYIEVCYYEDTESGDIISYELRLIDDSFFTGTWNGWYAKSYQFINLSDIQ